VRHKEKTSVYYFCVVYAGLLQLLDFRNRALKVFSDITYKDGWMEVGHGGKEVGRKPRAEDVVVTWTSSVALVWFDKKIKTRIEK
jgi:hypothetical protein